ncbi:protein mono-ADP-ribosyltransferase PARP3-like [Synchiropus picturatus]
MDRSTEIFKIIEKYLMQTAGAYNKTKIVNVWEVDRELEGDRFSEHEEMENRRLLWHGTKISKVAAILKNGLRNTSHSEGRVGRGIYFASEFTSLAAYGASYGHTPNNTCMMFLCEVALGREYSITEPDFTLNKAPPHYDSVVARGQQEPGAMNFFKISFG